jgi:hypothetical protein
MAVNKIIFGRNHSPISLAIQLRTKFKYSHVGWLIDDSVIEARGGYGVVETPLVSFKQRYRETEVREIHCPNPDAIQNSRDQIGKKYDNKSLWGIAIGFDYYDAHSYQCAGFIGKYSGIYDPTITHSLVPKDIWRTSHAIK